MTPGVYGNEQCQENPPPRVMPRSCRDPTRSTQKFDLRLQRGRYLYPADRTSINIGVARRRKDRTGFGASKVGSSTSWSDLFRAKFAVVERCTVTETPVGPDLVP